MVTTTGDWDGPVTKEPQHPSNLGWCTAQNDALFGPPWPWGAFVFSGPGAEGEEEV